VTVYNSIRFNLCIREKYKKKKNNNKIRDLNARLRADLSASANNPAVQKTSPDIKEIPGRRGVD
jgi:hypothetical protein